jgi:hypothetical protein
MQWILFAALFGLLIEIACISRWFAVGIAIGTLLGLYAGI